MRTTAVLSLIWTYLALAQAPLATLRIEVRAEGAPAVRASISVNGTSFETDARGIVEVPVPLGKAEIRVTKLGFAPGSASIAIDEAREWPVVLELMPQEKVEEEVTVYATRTGARLQDSPTRVEVLSREEIEEKTLMTPGDIAMMLNEMGGLRVQTTSPSLGAASVRIQGMRGRYTRFLSDGLPLFGQQGGGLGLLQIPPTDLGQVEVIKGVSSALYGAGAMAGVVNLISRRPTNEPVHEFLFNRTTRGATDGTIFAASPLSKRWSGSFLGGGHSQDRRDLDGDGWADLAEYRRGVIRPRVFWDGGEGRSALITGGVTYEDRTGGTVPGAVLRATGEPYIEALNTRRYDLGGSYQTLIDNRYVVTARVAGSLQQHDHVFGEVRERDRHELLFGEVAVRGSEGKQTWVAGAAAERDAYLPRDVPRFTYRYVAPAIFAQDDIALSPAISISASARADFHNRFGTLFSPRISSLIRWMGFTSRVSAGQGFFAPTPLTEETEAAGLSRLSIPAPLLVERGRSVSADLTRAIGPVSLTATAFRSSLHHPIHVDRDTRYQLTNLAENTINQGFEFLGTLRKAVWSATASYTFVDSRERAALGAAPIPLTPRHSFGITAMYEKDPWRIGVETYYTGRQRLEENPFRSQSEPYALGGFLIERRVGKVRLFLNAENLGDIRQTKWNSLIRPTRGVDGRWTVDAWSPLDGRVFNGGIRARF